MVTQSKRSVAEDDAEEMIEDSLRLVRGYKPVVTDPGVMFGASGHDGLSAAIVIYGQMARAHGEPDPSEFVLTWNGVFLSWVPASMIGKVDPYGNTFEQV